MGADESLGFMGSPVLSETTDGIQGTETYSEVAMPNMASGDNTGSRGCSHLVDPTMEVLEVHCNSKGLLLLIKLLDWRVQDSPITLSR
jgi:hypothetical protein